jgi:glutamate-5-semialdehyde dehydrogenase
MEQIAVWVREKAGAAKEASRELALASSDAKNRCLAAIARGLEVSVPQIRDANSMDMDCAKAKGLSGAMLDRLTLDAPRIGKMASALREIAALPDPVGGITGMWRRPNGLMVGRMRVPLGVVGVIYESRPDVTTEAAALCIKSGNAIVLRGGSEAINSNRVLAEIVREGLASAGLPQEAVQFLDTPDREAIRALIRMDDLLDVVVPRGGESLIRAVVEGATVPVIKHYKGVCHIFVDAAADLPMAGEICFNAKVQRPGVCNAMETMLVHADIAGEFLPLMGARLRDAGVEIRGCPETLTLLPFAVLATDEDWAAEFLDLILAVKVVASFGEAIDWIARYGSGHSEAIVTRDHATAMRFLREVDASAVFVNCSTRFNDGGELGLGAEMGISTQKLHVRGPMGLEDLTCLKYVVLGDGQVRG